MLVIMTENNPGGLEWHIGTPQFWRHTLYSQVTAIQADGDELTWLEDVIDNLPMWKNHRVQKWTGDVGRWIFLGMIASQPTE